ncbi:hypothetical protein DFS34DRAFT_57779 [Phlyctochytrium arcticum]|nr:hypothetical protein DFS34DRAFT_57779 [Phlyctochytrium arcticum]
MKTVGDKVMGFAKQKGKIMRVEGGKQAWSPSPCLFIEQLSPTAVKLANPAFAANTAAAPIPFQPPTSPPLSSASSNHTLIEPFASASTSLSEVDDSRDDSSYPSTGRPGSSLGCPAGDKASPAGLLGSASVSNSTLTLLGSSSTSVTSSLSTLPSGTAAPQGSTSTAAIASRMTLQSPVPTMTQWASSKVGEQAQLAINLFQATSVYTSPENQTLNITEDSDSSRERLNLNRRNLYNCLLLPNDTRLRLLNYQNNFISRIENLDHLKCLVFLDFYNNQIERIAGLSSLVHLRVLMLGRNRIKKIENLGPHTKLDVLDLHSNQIKVFENINHLQDLRVLNLEDNEIERVEGVEDLLSLAELNLKRNKIVEATNLCQLDTLKRLNLSHNEISSYEDIALTQLGNLIDFSIENNPVTHHTPHRSLILNRLANLKSLDGRRITDEERRTASKVAKREMERRKEWDRVNVVKEERERVISFIEGTWTTRTIQSTIPASDSETSAGPSTRSADPPTTLYLNSAGRSSPLVQAQARFQPPQLLMTPTPPSSRPGSASTRTGAGMRSKSAGKSRAFVPGGASKMLLNDEVKIYDGQTSYLELNGGRLSLFGPAHPHLAQLDLSAIHTAHLTCMDMPSVALAVSKLADALNLHTLVLDRNRFTCLKQVNLLSPLRTLTNFEVLPTDNPVTNSLDFRAYVLFRLGHLRLKSISGVAVESGEIESAERTFGKLARKVFFCSLYAQEYLTWFLRIKAP